ncbi:hypothetical protein Tco_1011495, partial [Tanacetum coccineum]
MNDPNITMEEYIRIEEEKAQSHGLVFNWQSAKFGRTEHYYEEECFSNFEEEFPAIVFREINRTHSILSKEGPPNDSELDFRISCDESDDKDYTVIFYENSFSYKIVFVNDLEIASENDDNNVASSHNPKVDHDYFNDFENEFPAIVYNDGLTSKSDLMIKTPVSTDKTDEFDPIDKTSLSDYEEEIISRFNDLFNDTHSIDSNLEINNDDNNIGVVQFSRHNARDDGFLETCHDETRDNFEIEDRNFSLVIYYCMIRMLFFFIMNLYVPFRISFDPKRYYKDGSQTNVAEAK